MSSKVESPRLRIKAIGQSGRLSDVQIVESIAVHIPDRDALMAVRVARQHRVERRHPRVEIDIELAAERVVATERRLGNLGEDRVSRAADQMRQRPSIEPPASRTRFAAIPCPTRRRARRGATSFRRRRCRSGRSCGGLTADQPRRSGSMEVMRNSATATSRTSSTSRRSSAPNARASSVASRGRSFALFTSSARLTRRRRPSIGRSRAPRKPGSSRPVGDGRRPAPRPREAHRTTRGAARRAPAA